MYINKNNILHLIPEHLINVIAENNDSYIDNCIAVSIDTLRIYLGKYDIEPELAKTDDSTKNKLIMNWACFITLYHLMQRIADNDVPQKVIKNFDDTIKSLEDVSKGKLNINLPVLSQNNVAQTSIRIGSQPLRDNKF